MGNYREVTPTMGETLQRATCFSSKIYAVDWNHHLYPLNSTEDGWDSPINFPGPPTGTSYNFVQHAGDLYVYRFNDTESHVFKFNPGGPSLSLIVNDTTVTFIYDMCSFDGDLYAIAQKDVGTIEQTLLRLNLLTNTWVIVSYLSAGTGRGLTNSGGLLWTLTDNNLSTLNITKDGFDFVCTMHPESPIVAGLRSYNGKIYSLANYYAFQLNGSHDGWNTVFDSGDLNHDAIEFNGRFYFSGNDILGRLNLTEDGSEIIWDNAPVYFRTSGIQYLAVNSNKLYFNCDIDGSILYQYLSMYVDFSSDRVRGFAPVTINFTGIVYSDFSPASTFAWTFGDTGTSPDQNPSHIYSSIGLYTISFSATSSLETIAVVKTDYIQIVDSTPIAIHNVEELQLIGNDPGYLSLARYYVANDFDASATIDWSSGAGFNPLPIFYGEFDGSNHTISNLYINRPSDTSVAIFSETNGAIFSNITFQDASIIGGYYCSIIASNNTDITATNCHGTGTISGAASVAGLFSMENNSRNSISGCSSNIIMTSGDTAGGLVNSFYGGSISDCCSVLNLNIGGGSFAGIASYISDSSVSGCSTIIDVTAVGGVNNSGGLLGYAYNSAVKDSAAIGNILMQGYVNTVGGFLGWLGYGWGAISDCTSNVNITANNGIYAMGGFSGYIGGETRVIKCSSTGKININTSEVTGYIGCFSGNSYSDLTNCYSTGDMTLTSTSQADYLGGFVGYLGSSDGVSIIECYSTGDLIITSPSVTYVGGFGGYAYFYSLLRDSFSSGNVIINNSSYTNHIGGFCGAGFFYANALRCHATGDVSGGGNIGGFGGRIWDGTMEQCLATGNVTSSGSSDSYAGGFVGYGFGADINYLNCYSLGSVANYSTGTKYTGGFAGLADDLTNCYSVGSVISTDPVGIVGGFIADLTGSCINCYWNVETSGQISSIEGEGKTSAEMRMKTTYLDWDFTSLWKLLE